jgi:hypothetical protein
MRPPIIRAPIVETKLRIVVQMACVHAVHHNRGPRQVVLEYPSPVSSSPTAFTLHAGSSNQFITIGTSMLPIAGYRFSLNAPSSAGASVTFVAHARK